jgi:glycosyltransferase involved in cell wall biosynthesis
VIRVALDARRAAWMPATGIGRYAGLLVEHRRELDSVELVPFGARGQSSPGWRIVPPGLTQLERAVWEQASFPLATRRFDVLHLPYYEGSPLARAAVIVNVHDLHTLADPRSYSWAFRAYYNSLLRLLVRRATLVLTGSQASVEAISALFPRMSARLRLVPYAYDELLRGARRGGSPLGSNGTVLYTGGYGPRKRVEVLIDGFAELRRRELTTRLVLTGNPPQEIRARVADRLDADAVELPGRVAVEELVGLYGRADVLAYPSAYEGFGYPALEALVAGVPLVAADSPSVREIVGDCGTLVPPDDPGALADGLAHALAASGEVREAVERGLTRAERYSPKAMVEAHARAYAEAAS